jgi:hypothetical protein
MRRLLSFLFALAVAVGGAASAFGTDSCSRTFGGQGGNGCNSVIGSGGATAQSIVTASTAKQYLTTTWSHAPTDATKATISYWQKFISGPTGSVYAFTTGQTSSTTFAHQYTTPATFYEVSDDSSSAYSAKDNTGSSPGTASWHHVCIQIDTTQATATNSVQFWLDGVNLGSQGTEPAQMARMASS